MIDNLELIKPLLEFTDEYDFYKITILIRKNIPKLMFINTILQFYIFHEFRIFN